jgi:hypothetical protein
MSRIKDIIIERQNTIIDLIRRLETYEDKDDFEEIFNAWIENGLPYDEDDFEELFEIVIDEEIYQYTINTAEKFLKEIEETT